MPADWKYAAITGAGRFARTEVGQVYEVEGRDTVTAAAELVRLSLNMAETHVDAGVSAHGRRLVYGGHTISVAAAQLTRAFPEVVSIIAWRECNHTAPVFEGDVLSTVLSIEARHALTDASGAGLLDVRALVTASREGAQEGQPVLDWRLLALLP